MKNQLDMPYFISVVKEIFKEPEITFIMEIGALDGKDSLLFKEAFNKANIFCIEGLKENYDKYLVELTTINPINIVVTNYDGFIDYHKKDVNGIHGIFNRGDKYGTDIVKGVPCKTIKTICTDNNITSLDMVKIDVEGATYEILEGMGDMLKTIKIMHIETENYPFFKGQKLHDEVVKLLIDNGFTMVDLSGVIIEHGGMQHDSIWVNNKFKK